MANAMEAAKNARAEAYETLRTASKEAAQAAWRAKVLAREAARAKWTARALAEEADEAREIYDEAWRELNEDEAVQGPLCEEHRRRQGYAPICPGIPNIFWPKIFFTRPNSYRSQRERPSQRLQAPATNSHEVSDPASTAQRRRQELAGGYSHWPIFFFKAYKKQEQTAYNFFTAQKTTNKCIYMTYGYIFSMTINSVGL
jgi:hypothetical protein